MKISVHANKLLPAVALSLLPVISVEANHEIKIDIDLSWSIPAYPSGGVFVKGQSLWVDGVGYTTPTTGWSITGITCPPGSCLWMIEYGGGIPKLDSSGKAIIGSYDISTVKYSDPMINVSRQSPDSGHINVNPVVTTPELRILRQLGSNYGPRVAAKVNPALQRATAIGATGILKTLGFSAKRTDNQIVLPSVTLDVIQWCSGLYTIKLMILSAIGTMLLLWRRHKWSTRLALLMAAPLIGLGINSLRVAGVGIGYEVFNSILKESTGWITLTIGILTISGLGWIMACARAVKKTQ